MSSLEKIIETQSKTIEMMANELTLLREQVEYLRTETLRKIIREGSASTRSAELVWGGKPP